MTLTYRHTRRACYLGFVTQAIAVNLAPVLYATFMDRFGLGPARIGALIAINFATQILSDLVATLYVRRIGYRPSLVLAGALNVLGLIALSILPRAMADPFAGLCVAVILYSWGSGLIEVLVSPVSQSLPGEGKASSMSLLHAFYCWGFLAVVLISTGALSLFGADSWPILPIAWAAIPLACSALFLFAPLAKVPGDEASAPIKALLKDKAFLLAMLLMVCSGSAEQTIAQWASAFAELGLGLPKLLGDLSGACLFALCMGIGRTAFGVYGDRFDLRRALTYSALGCVACYLAAALFPNPYLALAGCALCGFAVSLMWPGTLSHTSARFPTGGTALFGILAICGDAGCSLGPYLAGLVADAAGSGGLKWLTPFGDAAGGDLRAGVLAGLIFPLIMATALLASRRAKGPRLADAAEGE